MTVLWRQPVNKCQSRNCGCIERLCTCSLAIVDVAVATSARHFFMRHYGSDVGETSNMNVPSRDVEKPCRIFTPKVQWTLVRDIL